MARISILAALLIAALSLPGQPGAARNSDGRNWCRICGGVNVCYPDCGKK